MIELSLIKEYKHSIPNEIEYAYTDKTFQPLEYYTNGEFIDFIEVMVTVTRKALIDKCNRGYQDHYDLLIIIVFSPNLTKKDLDPYRRIIEPKKIKILHYEENLQNESLEMIRQIMWRGDF